MHAALVGYLWFAVQWHTSAVAPAVAVLWDLSAPVDTIQPPPPAPPAPVDTPPPPPPKEEVIAPAKPDIVQKAEKTPKPPKSTEPRKEPPIRKENKPTPQPSAKELKRQQQQAERQHQEEMARLTSQVGTPGRTPVPSSPGRLSNEYKGRVQAAVLANVHFAPPEGVGDSVYADYQVELISSTGELVGEPRLVHPSGLPGWDDAVRRAILRTDPFPRRDDGTAPNSLVLRFHPTDTR